MIRPVRGRLRICRNALVPSSAYCYYCVLRGRVFDWAIRPKSRCQLIVKCSGVSFRNMIENGFNDPPGRNILNYNGLVHGPRPQSDFYVLRMAHLMLNGGLCCCSYPRVGVHAHLECGGTRSKNHAFHLVLCGWLDGLGLCRMCRRTGGTGQSTLDGSAPTALHNPNPSHLPRSLPTPQTGNSLPFCWAPLPRPIHPRTY